MTILSGLFVSIRISITRAIGRKRHVFLVEFGLSTIRRIVFIISSLSLQPKEETIIKIAFDHNKIIELNFRLICKLQQNQCQSSKIQQFCKAFCNRSVLMSMLYLFWTYFSNFFFVLCVRLHFEYSLWFICFVVFGFLQICVRLLIFWFQTFNNIFISFNCLYSVHKKGK